MSRKENARKRSAELRAAEKRRQRRRNVLVQGGIIAVVAAVVIGVTLAVLQANEPAEPAAVPPGFDDRGVITLGDPEASVTVTVIEDFACPACQAFEIRNMALLEELADPSSEVRLDVRPIAFLDRVSSDEYSSRALNAAACVVADDEANWKPMHQSLFANQPPEGGAGLSDDQLAAMATQAGASSEVETCIAEREWDDWVKETTNRTLGLDYFSGTPTVLVNDTKIESPSEANIRAAIAAAQG